MSKFIKYVLVFIGCIYFVSRMSVFADCFGEENYNDWVEYYYSQQEDFDQVNNKENESIVVSANHADLFSEETKENNEFNEDFYHNHKYITDEDMYYDNNGMAKIIPDLDYIIGEEDYKEIYPNDKETISSDNKIDYNNPVVDSVTYSKGYEPRVIDSSYVIIRK